MNRDEIIDLLTLAAAYDRRTIGKGDVAAWLLALNDLPFEDARQAVIAHYSESTQWLMPGHVRDRVKRQRARRVDAVPLMRGPGEEAEAEGAYRARLKAEIKQIADGRSVRKALARGGDSRPSAEYDQVRGVDADPVRRAAMRVPCPWPACKAPAGTACVNAVGGRLKAPAHEGRLANAGLADWVDVNGTPRLRMRGEREAAT